MAFKKPTNFLTLQDAFRFSEGLWAELSADDRTFTANGTAVNALHANNAQYLRGKVEGQLSVLSAASATSALQLGGKLEAALDVNSAAWLTNATQMLSGTVPTARLGSGTANSTTVLFGNQTWGTLPTVSIANTTVNGYVSTTTQSFAGVKTFTANVTVNGMLTANGSTAAVVANDQSEAGKNSQFYMAGHFGRIAHSDYGTVVSWSNTALVTFADTVVAQVVTANGGAGFIRANDQSESGKFSYFYMAGHVGRLYHSDFGTCLSWANTGVVTFGANVVCGGHASIAGTLTGAAFSSGTNTASSTSGSPVTVLTVPSGQIATYILRASLSSATNDPTNYAAVSIVSLDGTTAKITSLVSAALMTITLSGLNVQLTQSSGGSSTVALTWHRMSS